MSSWRLSFFPSRRRSLKRRWVQKLRWLPTASRLRWQSFYKRTNPRAPSRSFKQVRSAQRPLALWRLLLPTQMSESLERLMKIAFQSFSMWFSQRRKTREFLQTNGQSCKYLVFTMVMVEANVLNTWKTTCTTTSFLSLRFHRIYRRQSDLVRKRLKTTISKWLLLPLISPTTRQVLVLL